MLYKKKTVSEESSYLLNRPDFSNWAMTDPSISPKNLPTCVKGHRDTATNAYREGLFSFRYTVWQYEIISESHDE